jgi:hypothetical protein
MESTIRRPAAVTTGQTTRLAATLLSSVGAAILGGIALAIVLIVAFMTVEKTSLAYALRPIGTFLYGDRMLVHPTPAMYAAAIALHLGMCVAWGLVYAAAASLLRVEASVPGALLLGVVVGLTALILDVHALVPQLEQARWGRDLFGAVTPPLFSFLGHVAFGLCFAVAPLLYRRLVRPTVR